MTSFITQWQKEGARVTVYGQTAQPSDDAAAFIAGTSKIEFPIVHADHGYVGAAPGFELPLILFVLANLAVLVNMRRKKNI